MQPAFSHRYTPILVMATFAMATVALGAYAYQTIFNSYSAWEPTTITISGEAEVTAIPDVASFTLAVRAEGDDATTAQAEATELNNAIIAYLSAEGVAETDIKTTSYNVSPRYRFDRTTCTPTFCPPGESVQDGFEVYQSLQVKVRETDKAGALLAGVGEAGASDISSLSFTIDDESAYEAEARAEAIKDAQAKAEVLAESLGVRLVDLVSFYEEEGYRPMPYYEGMGGDMMRSAEMAPAPDIQMGESTIMSRVNLTYKIK